MQINLNPFVLEDELKNTKAIKIEMDDNRNKIENESVEVIQKNKII